jgi:cytochrome b561
MTLSHRERLAWLLLIAIIIPYALYFVLVALQPPETGLLPNLPQLGLLALTATAHVTIQMIGRIWMRSRSPEDARLPADERDQAIERRSTRVAYYILIGGMILVGVVMPFSNGGWKIVNTALFMIVLAEVFHQGVAVWSYRQARA